VVRSEEVAAGPSRYDLGAFKCRWCGMQMQLIESEKRRPHFRHRGGVCGFGSILRGTRRSTRT